MSENILKTPLYDIHHAAGAKMVPFAGYSMPVSYSGIKQEHLAVRNGVGVFDVSHMGNFEVRGAEAQGFLESLTINGVHKLKVGDVQYSALCAEDGGMIDDILVYRFEENRYQVIVNAANKGVDWSEFNHHIEYHRKQKNYPEGSDFDLHLINRSDELGIIALQGPQAEALVSKIIGEDQELDLNAMKFYTCGITQFAKRELLFSRTGYTGEDGFEFYVSHDLLVEFWRKVVELGAEFELELCGLGARDTLRLEAGYSLYGHELSTDFHPLDSGLAWICDLETNFRGRDSMIQKKSDGPRTSIIGLEMLDKGIPREGYEIELAGEIIGVVTSGSNSPMTSKSIAMARVDFGKVKNGSEVHVLIRGKSKKALVTSRRFYVRGG